MLCLFSCDRWVNIIIPVILYGLLICNLLAITPLQRYWGWVIELSPVGHEAWKLQHLGAWWERSVWIHPLQTSREVAPQEDSCKDQGRHQIYKRSQFQGASELLGYFLSNHNIHRLSNQISSDIRKTQEKHFEKETLSIRNLLIVQLNRHKLHFSIYLSFTPLKECDCQPPGEWCRVYWRQPAGRDRSLHVRPLGHGHFGRGEGELSSVITCSGTQTGVCNACVLCVCAHFSIGR